MSNGGPQPLVSNRLKSPWLGLGAKSEQWCEQRPQVIFMGVPSFQALDMSAIHSAQEGGGNDCTRTGQGEGTIAKKFEKMLLLKFREFRKFSNFSSTTMPLIFKVKRICILIDNVVIGF